MTSGGLVYGAYGYTGRLVARRAVEMGLRPVLAGRDASRLEPLARELDLPWRAFPLDDAGAVARGLAECRAVLHCAGPFHRTWRAVVDGCLAVGAHYLDVTGEAEVFAAVAARGAEASRREVMLLPGVGFDVVPSDNLAGHLARRLPGSRSLTLAFRGDSGPSRGTALTMIDHLGEGGLVRRGDRLVKVPLAAESRQIDFGDGPEPAVSIPWGDVVTAWHSTGIPDITVFMAMPERAIRRLRRMRPIRPLLGLGPVKAWLRRRVERRPPGPSERRLAGGSTVLWGEVVDADGRRAAARLRGPQAYRWTAMTAVAALGRVLDGGAVPGFQTPTTAFGADFVLEVGGARREDL